MKKRKLSLLMCAVLCSNVFGTAFVSKAEKSEKIKTEQKEELNSYYAQEISKGYIGLENGLYDNLLYGQKVLNPNEDDDKDGILNKDEIYIYSKAGKKYIGYNSHPKLQDTDGDGILDKDDKNKLTWDISSRDMAMFMYVAYENDAKVNKIFNENQDMKKERKEFQMMNKEMARFWKAKKFYHYSNGFDAILFENTSDLPFLKNNEIQVLAVRGTNAKNDFDDDLKLFSGISNGQAKSIQELMDSYESKKFVKNLYITGHSLGGYLTQRATIYSYRKDYKWIKNSYTFNAPKIKSNIFTRWLKVISDYGDKLTNEKKSIHYKTDNDRVIYPVGNFKNAISIGKSYAGHSSDSYFEKRLNDNSHFNIGRRTKIGENGTEPENNLKKLKIIKVNLADIYAKDLDFNVKFSVEKDSILTDEMLKEKINIKSLPEGTVVNIRQRVLTNKVGDFIAKVEIIFKDSTKLFVDIKVKVEENKADLDNRVDILGKNEKEN